MDSECPYEDVALSNAQKLSPSSSAAVRRTVSERIGRQVLSLTNNSKDPPSEYGNTRNRITSSRRLQTDKFVKGKNSSTMEKPIKQSHQETCLLFYKTGNSSLDETLRVFEEKVSASGKQQSQEQIYFNKSFAGGTFNIEGGYLNLQEFKMTMYLPPRSIVAGSEAIYLHCDRHQTTEAPLLSDGEQLVSPIITCGKPGKESHMELDIVLSFPLYTGCSSRSSSKGGIDSLCDTLQTMRKDIGKDNQWKVLADEIDCLKVVTRGGRCTLMVNQLGCYAIVATNALSSAEASCDGISTVCVGIFGKKHRTADTVNIVVVFWRDSVADKQRVLAEELEEGLTLLDQARNIPMDQDDTDIMVELTNVKTGWAIHDQDHKRKFKVNRLLAQLDSCNLPSCTFALNYVAKAKCSTAQCTVEVCTKNRYAVSDPVKFEALIDTNPILTKSSKEYKGTSHVKSDCRLQTQPRPPPCLTYAPLREIATFLGQPPKGPRLATQKVWKSFAEKIGLTSSDISEVEGRYHIQSPGAALLDFYFGEHLSMRSPRDITAYLLTIFKRIGNDDIQSILKRELNRFDQNEKKRKAAMPLEGQYELIQEQPLPVVKPTPSPRPKSPIVRKKTLRELADSPGKDTPASNPELPPRSPSKDRPPEPPPKPKSDNERPKSPAPPPKSPKPSQRSAAADVQIAKENSSQKENPELTIYDKPSPNPVKRTSFLHSSSSAKLGNIMGPVGPSRISHFPSDDQYFQRSRSLPKVHGDDSSTVEGVPEADSSVKSNTIPKDLEGQNADKEESAYADISESERQGLVSLGSAVAEVKTHFEGNSRQEVQQLLSKAVHKTHKSGAKVLAATNRGVTQLKDFVNAAAKRSNQPPKPTISLPMPLGPDQPSPFKDSTPLIFKDTLPLYDSVPNEKPVKHSESSTHDDTSAGTPSPTTTTAQDENMQKQLPEPIYDHPEQWETNTMKVVGNKTNEYVDSPCKH